MNSACAENFGSAAVGLVASAWPEDWCRDWYVCDPSGVISGPVDAVDLFGKQDAGYRAVARRGFAQWYSESDFAGLWRASCYTVPQISAPAVPSDTGPAAKMELETQAPPAPQDEDILNALAVTGVSLAALAAPVAAAVTTTVLPGQQAGAGELNPRLFTPAVAMPPVESRPLEPRLVWLSKRAGARLGNLQNPVLASVMVCLSAGFYYVAWLLTALREVVWHLDHDTLIHRHVERPWLAWIPGGHILITRDLARLIRAMEEEDGYTSTSPALATALSIFPPFAAAYLQHAMNDHWLIHCLGADAPREDAYFPMQNELNTTSSTSSA